MQWREERDDDMKRRVKQLNPTARIMRAMRSRLGITQQQLASLAGLSVRGISSYENGARFPAAKPLLRLMLVARENRDPAEAHFAEHLWITLGLPAGWRFEVRPER